MTDSGVVEKRAKQRVSSTTALFSKGATSQIPIATKELSVSRCMGLAAVANTAVVDLYSLSSVRDDVRGVSLPWIGEITPGWKCGSVDVLADINQVKFSASYTVGQGQSPTCFLAVGSRAFVGLGGKRVCAIALYSFDAVSRPLSLRRAEEGRGGRGKKIFTALLPSGPLGVTNFSFNREGSSSVFPCLAICTGCSSEDCFVLQVHNNAQCAMLTVGANRGDCGNEESKDHGHHRKGTGPLTSAAFGDGDLVAVASGVSGYCAAWKLELPQEALRGDCTLRVGDVALPGQGAVFRVATFSRAARTTEELGELELTPVDSVGQGWREGSSATRDYLGVRSSSFASIPCSLCWFSPFVLHVTYADGSVRVYQTRAGAGSSLEQRHLLQAYPRMHIGRRAISAVTPPACLPHGGGDKSAAWNLRRRQAEQAQASAAYEEELAALSPSERKQLHRFNSINRARASEKKQSGTRTPASVVFARKGFGTSSPRPVSAAPETPSIVKQASNFGFGRGSGVAAAAFPSPLSGGSTPASSPALSSTMGSPASVSATSTSSPPASAASPARTFLDADGIGIGETCWAFAACSGALAQGKTKETKVGCELRVWPLRIQGDSTALPSVTEALNAYRMQIADAMQLRGLEVLSPAVVGAPGPTVEASRGLAEVCGFDSGRAEDCFVVLVLTELGLHFACIRPEHGWGNGGEGWPVAKNETEKKEGEEGEAKEDGDGGNGEVERKEHGAAQRGQQEAHPRQPALVLTPPPRPAERQPLPLSTKSAYSLERSGKSATPTARKQVSAGLQGRVRSLATRVRKLEVELSEIRLSVTSFQRQQTSALSSVLAALRELKS